MVPVLNFYDKFDLGAIFDLYDFPKRHSLDNLFAQRHGKKRSSPDDPGCPYRDPAFHETIESTVPLGPTGFLRSLCSTETS